MINFMLCIFSYNNKKEKNQNSFQEMKYILSEMKISLDGINRLMYYK